MRIYGRDDSRSAVSQSQFGIRSNIVNTMTLDLSNARQEVRINIGGSVLWALDATSRNALINVKLNDQNWGSIPIRQGFFIRGVPYSQIYITHAAQAGETITLLYAVEEDPSQISIMNPSLFTQEVDLTKATVLDTVADVTLAAAATTQILAANADRRAAFISNLVGNANTMRIGDNNAGATRGIPLAPGETIIVSSTEAIYGYNPGGAGEDVGVMWTED